MDQSRQSIWRVALILVAALAMMAGVQAAMGTDDTAQDSDDPIAVATLSGDAIPQSLRLSGYVSMLAKRTMESPESAEIVLRLLEQKGLTLELSELQQLAQLYGDFDTYQRDRLDSEGQGLQQSPHAQDALRQSILLERESFLGEILGRWLRGLVQSGHDVEAFLQSLAHSKSAATFTMSFYPEAPPHEEFERRARAFERSFDREFGRALQLILDADLEGGHK